MTEWDETTGPLGNVIGAYTKFEKLHEGLSNYFGSLILFHEGEYITREEIERLLLAIDPRSGEDCLIVLKNENDFFAMIYKCILNESGFIQPGFTQL